MEKTIEQLRKAYDDYNKLYTFAPGDIVVWKDKLQYKRLSGPFIIVEVLEEPIINMGDPAGTPYFRDRLDVRALAFDDSDGRVLCCYFNSQYFRPYKAA